MSRCSSIPTSCRSTTTGATERRLSRLPPAARWQCCRSPRVAWAARTRRGHGRREPDRRRACCRPPARRRPPRTSNRPTSSSTRPTPPICPTSASPGSTSRASAARRDHRSPRSCPAGAALMSDAPLDQYLLAATAWELLAGRPPCERTSTSTTGQIPLEPLPPVTTACPDLPQSVSDGAVPGGLGEQYRTVRRHRVHCRRLERGRSPPPHRHRSEHLVPSCLQSTRIAGCARSARWTCCTSTAGRC